jgi:hypothetical protein
VPKLAAQALSWDFSTKDMIGLRAARQQKPDPGRSVAGQDRRQMTFHDQDRVRFPVFGDAVTSAWHPNLPLRLKASSRAMRRILARHRVAGAAGAVSRTMPCRVRPGAPPWSSFVLPYSPCWVMVRDLRRAGVGLRGLEVAADVGRAGAFAGPSTSYRTGAAGVPRTGNPCGACQCCQRGSPPVRRGRRRLVERRAAGPVGREGIGEGAPCWFGEMPREGSWSWSMSGTSPWRRFAGRRGRPGPPRRAAGFSWRPCDRADSWRLLAAAAEDPPRTTQRCFLLLPSPTVHAVVLCLRAPSSIGRRHLPRRGSPMVGEHRICSTVFRELESCRRVGVVGLAVDLLPCVGFRYLAGPGHEIPPGVLGRIVDMGDHRSVAGLAKQAPGTRWDG